MASTHKTAAAKPGSPAPRLTADELRKIVGRVSDDRVTAILATGATPPVSSMTSAQPF